MLLVVSVIGSLLSIAWSLTCGLAMMGARASLQRKKDNEALCV